MGVELKRALSLDRFEIASKSKSNIKIKLKKDKSFKHVNLKER